MVRSSQMAIFGFLEIAGFRPVSTIFPGSSGFPLGSAFFGFSGHSSGPPLDRPKNRKCPNNEPKEILAFWKFDIDFGRFYFCRPRGLVF